MTPTTDSRLSHMKARNLAKSLGDAINKMSPPPEMGDTLLALSLLGSVIARSGGSDETLQEIESRFDGIIRLVGDILSSGEEG